MKKSKQTQSLNDLEIGVKQILKNRCSLSVDDQKILNDCLELIQELKERKQKELTSIGDQKLILKIFEILFRFFFLDNSDI